MPPSKDSQLPPPAFPPAGLPAELPPQELVINENDEIPQPDLGLNLTPTARDPFAKPKSLLEAEKVVSEPKLDPSIYVDKRIEAIRRFPLVSYILVGIIFDVENPKAIVKDNDNGMHLVTTNQRIGNQEGLITKIEKGELIVEEKGKIITLKLLK